MSSRHYPSLRMLVAWVFTATLLVLASARGESCTGEPCADSTHCRSSHGFCGAGDAWCNAGSIWTSECQGGGPDPTLSPTSPESGFCTGMPCGDSNECRSPSGECGLGAGFCNENAVWAAQGCCEGYGNRRLTEACSGEPCLNLAHCRSEFGYCGTGDAWCNEASIWTSACDGSNLPTTNPPTTKAPSHNPTTSPAPTASSMTPAPTTFTCPMPGATPAPSNAASTESPTSPPSLLSTRQPTLAANPTSYPTTAQTSSPASKEVGLYFAEWGIYGRNFLVKNMDVSGQAAKATFINYAFGNIYKKPDGTYQCDAGITKQENGNGDGGDAYAAYGKGFSGEDSVDGKSDAWDFAYNDPRVSVSPRTEYPLKGNFNQLKKLKAKYPQLKVLISLGGWSWSKWFSAASATQALRETLVSSCIDQYIQGNLPIDDAAAAGGIGSGAGVFDGIDIDWEYPGVQGVGYNTVDEVNDKLNMVLLFEEFRKQLDAFGATVDKKFYLTTAIGAGNEKIVATDPKSYSEYADWINVMNYDYHGGWETNGPTDFQANLYIDPASPNYASLPDYSTEASLQTLLGMGVPPKKLHLGVPFYGRGWTGVSAGPNLSYPGLYQPATGPASGTWEAGIEDYKVLKMTPGTVYTHAVTGQTYKFDGFNFWSYDTPADILRKVQYAKDHGLGGVFSWEADGDFEDELTAAMASIQD